MTGKKALVPPLGLLTVAALFPKDWQPHLVDLNVRPLTESDWERADIVFVTGMLAQREGLLSIIEQAKARTRSWPPAAPIRPRRRTRFWPPAATS
ncbi:MAG: hypothetical protein AB9872_02415 [Solidesulfovibrio sp.]